MIGEHGQAALVNAGRAAQHVSVRTGQACWARELVRHEVTVGEDHALQLLCLLVNAPILLRVLALLRVLNFSSLTETRE